MIPVGMLSGSCLHVTSLVSVLRRPVTADYMASLGDILVHVFMLS